MKKMGLIIQVAIRAVLGVGVALGLTCGIVAVVDNWEYGRFASKNAVVRRVDGTVLRYGSRAITGFPPILRDVIVVKADSEVLFFDWEQGQLPIGETIVVERITSVAVDWNGKASASRPWPCYRLPGGPRSYMEICYRPNDPAWARIESDDGYTIVHHARNRPWNPPVEMRLLSHLDPQSLGYGLYMR